MNRKFHVFAAGLVLTLLLTQFNNCGNYAQPATNPDGTTSLSCSTPTCISQNPDSLSITPHLGNGQYAVPSGLAEFNLGGDCNEVGFPYNQVHWELVLNGIVVRHSSMAVAGAQGADSRCVNGRFLLYINLAPITGDPVDRTGLQTGQGTRASYTLNIVFYGENDPNAPVSQASQTRAVVPLAAI